MTTKVKTYKSNRKAERGIDKMTNAGYTVVTHNTRNKKWSWLAGFFTRKTIHTVTYQKA